MKELTVIIEKAATNYSAYIDGVNGIAVTGKTIEEIQKRMKEAIEFYKQDCIEFGEEIPEQLRDADSLVYKMDAETLLNYYDGILSKTALEKLTGINQKQLWHYAIGKAKPRPAQKEKIINGLHGLGQELLLINI